jgi:hypothetical protein
MGPAGRSNRCGAFPSNSPSSLIDGDAFLNWESHNHSGQSAGEAREGCIGLENQRLGERIG